MRPTRYQLRYCRRCSRIGSWSSESAVSDRHGPLADEMALPVGTNTMDAQMAATACDQPASQQQRPQAENPERWGAVAVPTWQYPREESNMRQVRIELTTLGL